MTYIKSLTLTAFRNYETTSIDDLNHHCVVLIGDNGAGKTNCLEGITLLSPGRGLRGANVHDIQSQMSSHPWAVSSRLIDNDNDATQLGVGRDPDRPDKKIIRANGTQVKNQSELGDVLRTVWLTPQMDGLFLQGTSERRRFFDRLVATYDPAHVGRMTRYEKATRERLNLLKAEIEKKQKADALWLSALENVMAETSVAIGAARLETLHHLQNTIEKCHLEDFPFADITLNGDIENALQNQSALNIEDMARVKLQSLRHTDGQSGRTNFGVGRTDMVVVYRDKNTNATQCSTGEQKALLTTIILAHARMVAARFGAPPILLFDEITAHFDSNRRDGLFEILADMGGQVWLTGQDVTAFDAIETKSMVTIDENRFQLMQ